MLNRILPPPGPARLLTVITTVMSVGQGLWLAISAIYAVTVVHLTPSQLGLSVSVAAAIVLLCSIPLGHLADRAGPRTVQMWSYLVLTPLTLCVLLANGFWTYLAAVSVQSIAYRCGRSARKAMIAGLVPADDRVRIMAFVRSASNGGYTVGALVAGLSLAVGTRLCYQGAVAISALAFLATGLLTILEPAVPPVPPKPGPALAVLRDKPFLLFTVLDGMLTTHGSLLDVVLPLWVLHHTGAPRWMSAVILIVNTLFVVVVQTRAARGTETPTAAARVTFQGAVFIAVGCVVYALSSGASLFVSCLCLVLGAVAHAFGEVRQSAGSWSISFDLAPDDAQGQYQGTQAMGADLGKMFAPALFTWLVLGHGPTGWIVLAVGFALLGAAMPPIVARGLRMRARTAEPAAPEEMTAPG
ncbi:MFS transporter [Streptomyces sp. SL13]|uniref:MFS transporter n=1 Tax=Streptantibioticus silvisoli TaxID=2705255 RepID=A0AA90H9L9_9ACTN|nr:MFS transporter [Streptantibioticus silvisoli]MDI5966524.1 MFS transporter [Streptantibioticus silvisoli]MDI5973786.1 MFS transporter [Streptantibioticus silvisoli]